MLEWFLFKFLNTQQEPSERDMPKIAGIKKIYQEEILPVC